jgi:WG containing repeat
MIAQLHLILKSRTKQITAGILFLSCLALQACDEYFEHYGYVCGKNYKHQLNQTYVEDEDGCFNPKAEGRRAFNVGGEIESTRENSPNSDGKRGYLDNENKVVIQPQFHYASKFSEGLAAVALDFSNYFKQYKYSLKWGYIDKNGQVIIPLKFERVGQFREGLAPVAVDYAGKWGYINKKGQYVIPPTFGEAEEFSEGLAAVAVDVDDNYKWGFINKNGKVIIPLKFDIVEAFHDGVVCVSTKDKQGYIDKWFDKNGKEIK